MTGMLSAGTLLVHFNVTVRVDLLVLVLENIVEILMNVPQEHIGVTSMRTVLIQTGPFGVSVEKGIQEMERGAAM